MQNLERRFALVQLRVTLRERDRWHRCALAEDLRLTELMREAVRTHVRDLERRQLLRTDLESAQSTTPRPAPR